MRRGTASRRSGLLATAVALFGIAVPLRVICVVPLLGGKAAWRFNDWRTETDGVRGGASVASLKGVTDIGAEFSGELRPSELEAASAGMALRSELLPRPLTGLKGLELDVAEGDGREYNFLLKLRGAPAGAMHTFRFKPTGSGPVDMPFRDFVPMLRGKPAPQPQPPLNLERVEVLALQAESGGGQEEGPFSLTIRGLSGIPGSTVEPEPPARLTRWTCAACGTMNFVSSTACTRCGESPAALDAKREAKAKAEAEKDAKPSRWTCSGCGAMNFPMTSECHKCGAPKS